MVNAVHLLLFTLLPKNRIWHFFSFPYTQNIGLHLPPDQSDPKVLRPQFWLWINPGPPTLVPNLNALRDVFEPLKMNPWPPPPLHLRLKDVIQFRLWNTTEQFDGIPELKDKWGTLEGELFNPGGHTIQVPKEKEGGESKPGIITTNTPSGEGTTDGDKTVAEGASATSEADPDENEIIHWLGSKSSSSCDRPSAIPSDRLDSSSHRFRRIYLDADSLFLRDWQELWGWKGALANRWPRFEK